jgi:hypothetical protein
MLNAPFLLAAALAPNPDEEAIREAASRSTPVFGGETTWILGAMLAVAAVVFIWAIFLRKRPQTQRGSFVVTRARPEDRERGSSGRRRKRKRKADHPENLPRNPTLAEIGGLPPLRPDDPEPADGEGAPEAQR